MNSDIGRWALYVDPVDVVMLLMAPDAGTFFVHLHKMRVGNDVIIGRIRTILSGLN